MSIRTLVALLILVTLGIFVVANWGAFTAPASLSLIAGTVEAPLGVVMLGITAVVAALSLGYALYLQGSATREFRRMAQDLQAQRDLADRAEASRLIELKSALESRLDRISGASSAIQQSIESLALQLRALDERIAPNTPTHSEPLPPSNGRQHSRS